MVSESDLTFLSLSRREGEVRGVTGNSNERGRRRTVATGTLNEDPDSLVNSSVGSTKLRN